MSSVQDPEPRGTGEERFPPECEALLELIGVFAHDISNPLQGLTVLLELALDELSPTAESALKVGQSLEAVERLRHMIRDLSALARTRPDEFGAPDCATAIRRVFAVLERRLDRGLAEVVIDLQAFEGVVLPSVSIEFATLSALLGAVESLNEADHPPLVLSVTGIVNAESGCLRLMVQGREPGDTPRMSDLVPAKHRERSDAILRRCGGTASVAGDGALEFRWSFDAMTDG